MHRSVRLTAIPLALGLLALPAAAQNIPADTLRPRDTNPSVPADSVVEEVRHTVKRGDTLWDLAKHYLRDPFRWPEVFQRNTDVVENPHWIYPGEVLRIPIQEVRPAALAVATEQGLVVSRVVTRPSSETPTVFSLSPGRVLNQLNLAERQRSFAPRRGEIEAAPFLSGRHGPGATGRIVGTAERPAVDVDLGTHRFQLNDHAFVTGPSGSALAVGAELMSFEQAAEVSDTVRLMAPTGVFRVVEPAIGSRPAKARLVRLYGEVFIGQRLMTPPQAQDDGRELMPVPGEVSSQVIWVHDSPVLPSLQNYVVLAQPRGASLSLGDRLTLVDQSARGAADSLTPPEDAAVVQVVRVTPLGATAVVIAHKLPTISEGMHARLSARLR